VSIQRRFKKPVAVQLVNTVASGPRLLTLQDAAKYLAAHPWALGWFAFHLLQLLLWRS
jgi:hypothetical protein